MFTLPHRDLRNIKIHHLPAKKTLPVVSGCPSPNPKALTLALSPRPRFPLPFSHTDFLALTRVGSCLRAFAPAAASVCNSSLPVLPMTALVSHEPQQTLTSSLTSLSLSWPIPTPRCLFPPLTLSTVWTHLRVNLCLSIHPSSPEGRASRLPCPLMEMRARIQGAWLTVDGQ
jgi:hypothetical protein